MSNRSLRRPLGVARQLGKRQGVAAAQRPLARRTQDCCKPGQLVFVHVQGQGGRQDALLRNRESRPRLGEVVGVKVELQDASQQAQAHFRIGSGVILLVKSYAVFYESLNDFAIFVAKYHSQSDHCHDS